MIYHLAQSIAVTALFLLCLPAAGMGAEYQGMTTPELSKLRGTMYSASQEERDAFRAAWQERVNQMTPEEKQQYIGSGGGMGPGNRSGAGLGDGTGRGRGGSSGANGAGTGAGNGQGAGKGSGRQ